MEQKRFTNHERTTATDIPLLTPSMSHRLGGRPYIFISDRDLPVRRFSSRDLGLCFKTYHPSVYDDAYGFYIAFASYGTARDCFAQHGDGKSYIDGYRLRMKLIDDRDTIRAQKQKGQVGSPPRRKVVVKKTVEEEATEAIVAELKEVFLRDVRSRIVNPKILDFLDPALYKDVESKIAAADATQAKLRPEVKVTSSPIKREPVTLNRLANRLPLLPRFRKKGEPVKDVNDIRKPTRADIRPMHHQFNDYSDSEDEKESAQREATAASDDEDESSRPSRETTTVSTPEPLRAKPPIKTLTRAKESAVKQELESEDEILKMLEESTKPETAPPTKRKRVIEFTSSEDEGDLPSPAKKVCTPEAEVSEAMEVDATPKLSKAAILKAAKAKAAAVRRAKKAEAKVKAVIEPEIMDEVIPLPTGAPKLPEVNLEEIEDDNAMLLDLDGVQTLVRDQEDYRYLSDVLADITPEVINDIPTWAWSTKKIKSLNQDGAIGPVKIPEPPAYNRINATGSARTEGYVKIPEAEKSLYLPQRNRALIPIGSEAARKTSRMNRVNNRRLAADMEVQKKVLSTESDILRFNQLKARKKQLKFARSPIHDWGLFAMEDIDAHEMVIEYVGEIIRFQVAELREKQYERVGIGSSYLFRVDDENIIDGMAQDFLAWRVTW
jgi:histone-lysine N-methyltransferase SETD1